MARATDPFDYGLDIVRAASDWEAEIQVKDAICLLFRQGMISAEAGEYLLAALDYKMGVPPSPPMEHTQGATN